MDISSSSTIVEESPPPPSYYRLFVNCHTFPLNPPIIPQHFNPRLPILRDSSLVPQENDESNHISEIKNKLLSILKAIKDDLLILVSEIPSNIPPHLMMAKINGNISEFHGFLSSLRLHEARELLCIESRSQLQLAKALKLKFEEMLSSHGTN